MAEKNTTSRTEVVAFVNIISDTTLEMTDTVINCILINIIALLGSVGNVINILVLARHGFTDSTNVLLMSVTVADLLFLLTLILLRINCLVAQIDQVTALTVGAIISAYLAYPNRYFGLVSSVFVVVISIERFVAVFFPLGVSRLFSSRKMCVAVVMVCLIWLGLTGPLATITAFVWTFSAEWNTTVAQTTFGTFYIKNREQLGPLNLFISISRGPVSVVIIFSCSIAIGTRLRTASQMRSKMTKSVSRVDVKVVKMLVAVCLVYAIIAIPLSVPYIFYRLRPDLIMRYGQFTNLLQFLESISDLLYVLNASVNFLIYVTMSAKFYKTYIELFSCDQKT